MRNTSVADQDMSSDSRLFSNEGLGQTDRAIYASTPHTGKIISRMTPGEDVAMRGLLTVKEAAAWLAISPATCYRLMERGTLRSLKIGGARRVRLSDLHELIAHEM